MVKELFKIDVKDPEREVLRCLGLSIVLNMTGAKTLWLTTL